ncbi:hypothetical protein SAMN05428976_106168 [Clostridium sp. USBA 49]|jgi:hypothetical protein|uniref:hypothetical protein n=1 Tax=Clostridium TaxID=1485 RepID=UPI0009994F66|nr:MULTISPECIES: hypothetical protein [Clostridium]SKA84438.1 hypothetical protein SAMN05428976_106168 [Clostridium sp. USBA 49]
MFNNFTSGNNNFFPIFINRRDFDNGGKLYHDSYEVYVNNDYVGRKTLIAESESVDDIKNHLKSEGFQDFNTNLKGNHLIITSNSDEAYNIKKNLNVYLNVR